MHIVSKKLLNPAQVITLSTSEKCILHYCKQAVIYVVMKFNDKQNTYVHKRQQNKSTSNQVVKVRTYQCRSARKLKLHDGLQQRYLHVKKKPVNNNTAQHPRCKTTRYEIIQTIVLLHVLYSNYFYGKIARKIPVAQGWEGEGTASFLCFRSKTARFSCRLVW